MLSTEDSDTIAPGSSITHNDLNTLIREAAFAAGVKEDRLSLDSEIPAKVKDRIIDDVKGCLGITLANDHREEMFSFGDLKHFLIGYFAATTTGPDTGVKGGDGLGESQPAAGDDGPQPELPPPSDDGAPIEDEPPMSPPDSLPDSASFSDADENEQ